MARNVGIGKVLLIIGGLVGIFSIFAYFIDESFGAWWRVSILNIPAYMNVFGLYSGSADLLDSVLGLYGLLGGITFLIGSLIALITAFVDKRSLSLLGLLLMIAGIALFLIGLTQVEDYDNILSGLSALLGTNLNIFFGSTLGSEWGLSIGFFIAIAAVILSLIGVIVYD